MKNKLVFGNSDSFAIEISENSKVAALRIWINGKSYGTYKKRGELIHSIEDLKILLTNLDKLYEIFFDEMDANAIFSWLLSVQTEEDNRKTRKYVRFLGDQMDDKSMFCYIRGLKLEWAFYNVKTKKIHTELIDKKAVVDACVEYINWYESLDG
jgi:trehalose-6-phosphatase